VRDPPRHIYIFYFNLSDKRKFASFIFNVITIASFASFNLAHVPLSEIYMRIIYLYIYVESGTKNHNGRNNMQTIFTVT